MEFFFNGKFSLSPVSSYDTVRERKHQPFMSVQRKSVFLSLSCTENKLKTFTTKLVTAKVEYIELKNNYFLHQELHQKKPLHYFKKAARIFETDPVLLIKNNTNLTVIFSKTWHGN